MNAWKPQFSEAPLAEGLAWRRDHDWRYEEKKDGIWCERQLGAAVLVGELCQEGRFWVFDVPIFHGVDVSGEPLKSRLEMLGSLALPAGWERIPRGQGGEFLREVLERGGEGIVAKRLDSIYGDNWIKCKRVQTEDCIVAERHRIKDSVRLEQRTWGGAVIECGWASVFGNRFAGIRVGDVVEVRCHSRHTSGRLREPRIVRARPDKAAAECLAAV